MSTQICSHCNGYGSSLADPIGADTCTKCGGSGLALTTIPHQWEKDLGTLLGTMTQRDLLKVTAVLDLVHNVANQNLAGSRQSIPERMGNLACEALHRASLALSLRMVEGGK